MEQKKWIYFYLIAFVITVIDAVVTCPHIWTGTQFHCPETESGGKCNLTCYKGFHLIDRNGQLVREKAEIICRFGKWDEIPVTCVVDTCADLKDSHTPEGTRNDSLIPEGTWNDFCAEKPNHYCQENKRHGPACVCDYGFQLDDTSNCTAVQFCPGHDSPANGKSDCQEKEVPVNGQCTFTCDASHKLNGSSTLTCKALANWTDEEPYWNGEAPICQWSFCKERISQNISKTWDDICRNDNKECVEDGRSAFCGPCLEGFKEDPQNTGTCIAFRCPQISTGTQYNCPETESGGNCELSCNRGFHLVDQNGQLVKKKVEIFCRLGKWDDVSVTCVEDISSACPDLLSPSGGMVAGDCAKARPGAKCLFACESGRKLVGEGILVCLDKGSWNFKTPTCTGFSVQDCDSLKDGKGETWRQVCERENRPCVYDPIEGPKCGCEQGLTEICLCTKKRQLLQGFLSYIIQGRNNRYIAQIDGRN